MIALGIDPDTKNTGIAIVSCDAVPEVIYFATVKVKASLPVETRILHLSRAIAMQLRDLPYGIPVEHIVVEGQRVYPRSKVRPQDLIHLAQVAGLAAAHAQQAYPLATLCIPEPRVWKGTVEKGAMQRRILKRVGLTDSLEGVDGVEKMTKTQRGHVVDAIGLALWGLGKLNV